MNSDESRISEFFDQLVERYGHGPRALDATSDESLNVRYSAISDVGDMTGKSVLDVGCGFGDLGMFLRERYDGVQYQGIDISRRMVDEGRRMHPTLELDVGTVSGIPPSATYDFVVASGIFYLLQEDPLQRMREIVEQMFGLATEAVAITSLSTWGRQPDPGEFRIAPGAALELGRGLTRSVVLRHDYHPGDLALYLYRREWS